MKIESYVYIYICICIMHLTLFLTQKNIPRKIFVYSIITLTLTHLWIIVIFSFIAQTLNLNFMSHHLPYFSSFCYPMMMYVYYFCCFHCFIRVFWIVQCVCCWYAVSVIFIACWDSSSLGSKGWSNWLFKATAGGWSQQGRKRYCSSPLSFFRI